MANSLKIWLMAARPKTLWAGVCPVIIGTAMAYRIDALHMPSAIAAAMGAILIQIGTNLANDYFDHVKGADTSERIGPLRATQAGLISPRTMLLAAIIIFLLACVPGLYIVYRGGLPFVIIGLVSILCGILYTGGPYPLGYLGLGDLFVLIFFGPVAVGGTFYLQTHSLTFDAILAGLSTGLFSVAILTVNNLRDITQDRAAGKKTLPVRFGPTFAKAEYIAALVVAAFFIPLTLVLYTGAPGVLISSAILFLSVPVVRTVLTKTDGAALNDALAATGKLLLAFSLLFSVGWNL